MTRLQYSARFFKSLVLAVFLILGQAGHQALADAQASSRGVADWDVGVDVILPGFIAAATGGVCVHASAGTVTNTPGRPPPFVGLPFSYNGVARAPGTCTVTITKGALAGSTFNGSGFRAPKFPPVAPPPPNTSDAKVWANVAGGGSATTSIAGADWTSSIVVPVPPTPPIPVHTSVQSAIATVSTFGPAPQAGRAAAESDDPWFFTVVGDDPIAFHLRLLLRNVRLHNEADAGESVLSHFEAEFAFGEGTMPGSQIIAQGDFFHTLIGPGEFERDMMTLIDLRRDLFPGHTYWLTGDIRTVAEVVPEPSTLALLGIGVICMALGYRCRRSKMLAVAI